MVIRREGAVRGRELQVVADTKEEEKRRRRARCRTGAYTRRGRHQLKGAERARTCHSRHSRRTGDVHVVCMYARVALAFAFGVDAACGTPSGGRRPLSSG